MRTLSIDRPFTAGMVTDLPAHEIGAQNSVFAQDGYSPQGMFVQRKGWKYDGSVADVAGNLTGVARIKFSLAAATRTTTATTTNIYIHNSGGSGTALANPGWVVLPRCVYHDELIWCAQDGLTPLIRYSGAGGAAITFTGTMTSTANQATISGGTFGSLPTVGYYFRSGAYGVGDLRLSAVTSTSSVTLEDVRYSSNAWSITGGNGATPLGTTAACVLVYNAGTMTVTTTTATGFGTKWDTFNVANGDGFVTLPPTGNAQLGGVTANASSETSLTGNFGAEATKSAYAITRACPFKDAAAHKGSLWGMGVAQFPARVYVSPPGWNPAFPPGITLPVDPVAAFSSANANDFFLDFIDVPAPDDTDANIAILDSPNPLLVLKREAVYGVYGSFGGLSVDMVSDGIGCIDIRSAQSFDEGQFWAGEGGIYWYTGGQVRDLTSGKINREWRSLTHDFDYGTSDFCTTWIASGHLFVGIITGGGATKRTYVCDLRDGSWQSRFSNMTPVYGFTSRIPGEKEKALIVGGDIAQGRVADVVHCIDGGAESTAKDAAGSFPRLQAYTSSALAQSTGIDGLSRMVDLSIHANVVDAGAAGSTQMTPTVVQGGGIANEADVSTALTAISSDTVDRIDRVDYRPAKQGRFHQVRLAVGTLGTDTAATKVEVAQLVASFRDRSSHA